MSTLTDAFGRTITHTADGIWATDGIAITAPDEAAALRTFNAMAPANWTPPPLPPVTDMTPTAFLRRFTDTERMAIAVASTSHPALLLGMVTLTAASAIDLTDPQVEQFLTVAVQAGALTAERMTVVMTP